MRKLAKAQVVGRIKIKREKCKGCQLCITSCPKGLIKLDKSLNKRGVHPVYFAVGPCSGCALCAQICPECCIEVYKDE